MTSVPHELPMSRRPLEEVERRLLRAKIQDANSRSRRLSKFYVVMGGAICLLWLWTMLASNSNWIVITASWAIVGLGMTAWVSRDVRAQARMFAGTARGLQSALDRNAADVYDVHAVSFVELQEIEDEGGCYAFQLEGDRILFIAGQEFYESARFLCLDSRSCTS